MDKRAVNHGRMRKERTICGIWLHHRGECASCVRSFYVFKPEIRCSEMLLFLHDVEPTIPSFTRSGQPMTPTPDVETAQLLTALMEAGASYCSRCR